MPPIEPLIEAGKVGAKAFEETGLAAKLGDFVSGLFRSGAKSGETVTSDSLQGVEGHLPDWLNVRAPGSALPEVKVGSAAESLGALQKETIADEAEAVAAMRGDSQRLGDEARALVPGQAARSEHPTDFGRAIAKAEEQPCFDSPSWFLARRDREDYEFRRSGQGYRYTSDDKELELWTPPNPNESDRAIKRAQRDVNHRIPLDDRDPREIAFLMLKMS